MRLVTYHYDFDALSLSFCLPVFWAQIKVKKFSKSFHIKSIIGISEYIIIKHVGNLFDWLQI